jgi:hypothetical protein
VQHARPGPVVFDAALNAGDLNALLGVFSNQATIRMTNGKVVQESDAELRIRNSVRRVLQSGDIAPVLVLDDPLRGGFCLKADVNARIAIRQTQGGSLEPMQNCEVARNMMETGRLITIAFTIVAASLAGCASVAEKNADQCEQMMQSKAEPALVSVTEKQPAPDGRSVLVTGMLEDQRLNTVVPAKVECRFDGKSLAAFHWLAPATLADSDDTHSNARNMAHY